MYSDGSIKSEQTSGSAKISYEYERGRLVRRGSEEYSYDNIGNCTNFAGTTLGWYRGNLLNHYGSNVTYEYDNQGVRFKKVVGTKATVYFRDGAKIIDELRGKIRIRYLYDAEELIGFRVGNDYYYYVKDVQGNVRAILRSGLYSGSNATEVAHYDYDAWGRNKKKQQKTGKNAVFALSFLLVDKLDLNRTAKLKYSLIYQ